MHAILGDVRFALRLLARRPGFAAITILTLALGIGATTAIFTVVHAVLLSPLPFPRADRLVEVRIVGRDGEIFPLPDADFQAWRAANRTADAVAVFSPGSVTLTGFGAPERLQGVQVTDRFFDVLGVRPRLGRALRQGDDAPGAPKTVVLSYAFWMRRFHGDPAVVGRAIALDGESHLVVGVMPAGFRFPDAPVDVWTVLTMKPPRRRGPFYTWGIARLGDSIGMPALQADLNDVAGALKRRYPGPEDWTLAPIGMREAMVGDVRTILLALFGAVTFLMLIATANVANLLLARAATRDREIAIRGALGAGRRRIVRQLIVESVVLALVSGAIALLVAGWGTRALLAMAPEGLPRLTEVRMNLPVFGFTLTLAAVCGVLFGLAPALRAARTPLVDALKDGGRGGPGGGHRRVQGALVVAEIALALMLSVGAGLMIRSFAALQRVSPGFEPAHLLTFLVSLPDAPYDTGDKVRAFYTALLARLDALPGVTASGLTNSLPPHLLSMTDNFMPEGMVLPPNQSAPLGPLVFVNETYFTALGAPLVAGRFFTAHDDRSAPEVVIVNEALAKRYFPDGNAVGQRLKDGGPERPHNPWMRVVGVVGDIKYSGLDRAPEPTVYWPFRQQADTTQYVVLRTTTSPQTLAGGIRRVVAGLDRDVPITDLETMDQLMAESVAPPRFRTRLVSVFAVIGLLLATVGTYGVMACAVTERRYEIGVRMALGASRAAAMRMVLGEAAALAAAGVLLGVAGAFATTRLIRAMLFGIAPTDAATFVAISALLMTAALAASYVPARRAMDVEPLVALRGD